MILSWNGSLCVYSKTPKKLSWKYDYACSYFVHAHLSNISEEWYQVNHLLTCYIKIALLYIFLQYLLLQLLSVLVDRNSCVDKCHIETWWRNIQLWLNISCRQSIRCRSAGGMDTPRANWLYIMEVHKSHIHLKHCTILVYIRQPFLCQWSLDKCLP